ncbi:MAG: ATP-binding cassette domain-containing protein, partial [Gemmatimonadaceae bacterium]|nr:ATP-binding cassette domain-containing protein [Acetobacteraceae bacterium]
MTAVELVDATLGFPGRCVLHGVSLTVAAGAFVGVLGPNGAGKTTLLRAILGLVTPQSGTVRVLGRPAVRGHAQIGYLPQAHSAAGLNLAGRDVLLAGLWDGRWRFAWPDREAQRDVDRALDLVDAGALARRPMRT